jgi:uracil-DNA glycosylase
VISLENVYATNLFKYFYTIPPAGTMKVLRNHLEPNLELLKQELSEYKNIPVITLGEPVLQLLTNEKAKVREYWGYDKNSGRTNGNFTFSSSKENNLDYVIFPFCHQPSLRKNFYKDTLMDYIKFMKNKT